MSEEFKIKASLDVPTSQSTIEKDLKTIANQINAEKPTPLQIVGGLKLGDTQRKIQAQLNTISKNLNVDLGVNTNSMQTAVKQVQTAVSSINNSLTSVSGNGVLSNNFTKTFDNTKNALELAKREFAQFNNVSSVTGNWIKGMNGNLIGFTVNVKDTAGAIENFRYRLEEIDKVKSFFFQGSTGADSGILKMSQDIENAKVKYERLIADFKSSNSAIIAGLSQPLSEVEMKLNTLGDGTSIKDLANSFEKLKTSASEITRYLDTTNNSFNKSTNAVNNYKNMDVTLTKLTTDYDNLIVKNAELGMQISNAKTKLSELQAIEKQNGTNVEWAKKYQLVNAEIKSITTNLQLAQKSESADKNSVAQQQLKYYSKIREELTFIRNLKKKLAGAGTEENVEIQRQIINAQKRIGYDEKQIQKKKLYNETLFAEINALKNVYAEQDKINKARTNDKTNASNLKLSTDIQKQSASLTTLEQKWKNQGILTGEFKTKVDQLKVSLGQVNDTKGLTSYTTQLKIVDEEAKRLYKDIQSNNTFSKQSADTEKLTLKTKNLIAQIRAYQQLNQKAMQSNSKNSDGFTYKQQLDEYITTLQKAGGVTKEEFAKIQLGFRNVTTEIRGMGLQGNTFLGNVVDKVKKFAGWMGITTVVSTSVRDIRNMINEVVELDTALVDLKKTSDATESQLKNFYYTANDTAKALGVSTVAVVQATSEWSRLGFSISEATKLAENSAIFKAISPEMTAEQATDGLVASIKAYGIGVEDTLDGIISKVNVLGNKFAVSNQDVIEVITRSASAMASANNSFEQTAALGVAATEITRDSASVGTALKTISMRVRAMDEETQQYDETLKSIKGDIYELTGVSIMSDANTYRSTYDILKDISLVWDNLTDKTRAQTLESLFGKRQANIGSAILSNFESAERALDEMANSQGGALKEMETIYDSIDYKANRFKETLTGIAQSSITQDFLKNTIDLGTGLLEILNKLIDKLGIVPTLISAITVGIGAKNAFSGTGRAKYDCPYKYARISSGGNTERVYAKMVA